MERVLEGRPLSALSYDEQEQLRTWMGEAEYDQVQQFLANSKKALRHSPPPDPAIRGRLLDAMRQRQQKKAHPIRRLMAYQIPAWQAAAAVALVVGAFLWLQKAPPAVVQTEKIYVSLTDTIYKEVAMPPLPDSSERAASSRVNVKPGRTAPQPFRREAVAVADSSGRSIPLRTGQLPDSVARPTLDLGKPQGRSANDLHELWDYVGEVF